MATIQKIAMGAMIVPLINQTMGRKKTTKTQEGLHIGKNRGNLMDERYERAAARWLAQRTFDSRGNPRDPDKITAIELGVAREGCPTCSIDGAAIDFKYAGRYETYELSATEVSVAQFVQEVVELLEPAPD